MKKGTYIDRQVKRSLTKVNKKSMVQGGEKAVKRRNSKLGNGEVVDNNEDDFDSQSSRSKGQEYQKLTEAQLNEFLPLKMLLPNNPQAAQNEVTYNYRDRKFEKNELLDQLVIHFQLDSELMLKESNEAKVQEEIQEYRDSLIQEAIRNQDKEDFLATKENINAINKTLRNKFNFNERGSMTINNPVKVKGISTEPPMSNNFSQEITQWKIFDSYINDYKKNLESQEGYVPKEENKETSHYSVSFKKCVKIMERMIIHAEEETKYEEYKYFLNSEDDKNPLKSEPILYPIWRLSGEKQRRKNVTSISWNPKYTDLFAVGYGYYDFMRNVPTKPGLICVYSLKNINHPELTFTTESGVMSLNFHPNSPALLCVGLYDGTVLVYDIRSKIRKAIYQSSTKTGKHTDPVWQIQWNPDISKKKNFYSISSDGRVMNWILMKNKLEAEEVIKLKLAGSYFINKPIMMRKLLQLDWHVDFVSILTLLNTTFFQQAPKKEKSINVLGHIPVNIQTHSKVIQWPFTKSNGIHSTRKCSFHVRLTGV